MKTLWPPWCCLCLALLAGCSSSSEALTEEITARKQIAQPEWATADASAIETAGDSRIRPIPDDLEENSSESTRLVIKPFPDDDLR